MTIGKDSQIVQVGIGLGRERECKRVGEDCPGQGMAEEGNPGRCSGWNVNVFNG